MATKNGAIDLDPTDGEELTVDATAKTRRRADDLDADYRLDTKHGRATVDGLTTFVDTASKTQVSGELGAGGRLLDARTKNGAVALRPLDD